MKKVTCVFLCVCLLLTSLTGCGSVKDKGSGDKIVFRMALADSESSNYYKGALAIADEVKEATDGRIEIDVIAGAALGGERDTVELSMTDSIDISTAANSVLTNWIPEMGILDQAYLWDNADQAHAAVDGELGDLIKTEANEKMGLQVIGFMESGFRNVFSTKPIKSIEDFHGIKIRTMQNPYHMAAFEAFGAMPTSMAAGEQFTALQQGTIDACESAVSNCLSNGFYEVTKNISYSNHAFVYIVMCMSDKAWNRIPEDLQQPFLDAVQRGCVKQRQYLVDANEEAVEELKTLGVEFHDLDMQELKNAYQEIAVKKGFEFDPAWQAAVDKAVASAPPQ